MDADVTQALGPDGVYYADQPFVTAAVQDNITWATANALPNFDPTVLVTGEHSGLKTLPQQPSDNPYLGPGPGRHRDQVDRLRRLPGDRHPRA